MNTASFTVSKVSELRRASGDAWREFLAAPNLSMGVYHVPAGGDDRETHAPHDRDEVYIGISGRGRLTAGDEQFAVEAGAIVYVKAGVEHYFHDVADELTLLVFFAGTASDEPVR